MSAAASQAAAFYEEVARSGAVWTVKDAGGFPAPEGELGKRAMPFWSSESRASKIVKSVAAYAGFEVVRIEWSNFEERWAAGLQRDGLLVGINWSGSAATGYDIRPDELVANVKATARR